MLMKSMLVKRPSWRVNKIWNYDMQIVIHALCMHTNYMTDIHISLFFPWIFKVRKLKGIFSSFAQFHILPWTSVADNYKLWYNRRLRKCTFSFIWYIFSHKTQMSCINIPLNTYTNLSLIKKYNWLFYYYINDGNSVHVPTIRCKKKWF